FIAGRYTDDERSIILAVVDKNPASGLAQEVYDNNESVAAEQRQELSPGRGFASPGWPRPKILEPRSGDRALNHWSALTVISIAAPQLPELLCPLTQGSQSLALGLALNAAPQLPDFLGKARASTKGENAKPTSPAALPLVHVIVPVDAW